MSRSPRASLNSPSPAPSPKAPSSGPSTSKPRPNVNGTASPTPRRATATPAAPPLPRGPTPSALETSYHKRLRSILLEHKKLRKEWNELVLRGVLGRCKGVIDCWVEVENGIRLVDKSSTFAGTKGKGKEVVDEVAEQGYKNSIRAGYLYSQSIRLSDGLALIGTILNALNDILSTMNSLVERAEGLVIEGAKTRGTAFAFREPLWVTWPLSRFADGLAELTSHYSPSLILIRSLVDTLTTFPVLADILPPLISPLDFVTPDPDTKPTPPPPSIKPIEKATATKESETRRRPKSEELQACMSLLAVQPLIPGKMNQGSPEAWEEICCVEVGNWSS